MSWCGGKRDNFGRSSSCKTMSGYEIELEIMMCKIDMIAYTNYLTDPRVRREAEASCTKRIVVDMILR